MDNQIQNKSWIRRHPVLTTLIVVLVLYVIGVSKGLDKSPAATSQSSDNKEEIIEKVNKVGDRVQLGKSFVTVNKVSFSQAGQFAKPSSGNTWLNLNITIENTDSSQQYVTTLGQMFVRDKEGNSYQVSSTDKTMENINERLDGTIIAKSKRTGWVGFEIPKTATGFQFQYNESLWGKDTITIDLGK